MKIQTSFFPRLFLFFGVSIALSSCVPDNEEPAFVEGELIIVLEDDTGITTIFDLLDTFEPAPKIQHLNNFNYSATADSTDLTQYLDSLASRPYLDGLGISPVAFYSDGHIFTRLSFFDLTEEKLADWQLLSADLNLQPLANENFMKWGVLEVEPGTEKDWIEILEVQDGVGSVELNHVITLDEAPGLQAVSGNRHTPEKIESEGLSNLK